MLDFECCSRQFSFRSSSKPTDAKGNPPPGLCSECLQPEPSLAMGQAVPAQPSLDTAGRLRGMKNRASDKAKRNTPAYTAGFVCVYV